MTARPTPHPRSLLRAAPAVQLSSWTQGQETEFFVAGYHVAQTAGGAVQYVIDDAALEPLRAELRALRDEVAALGERLATRESIALVSSLDSEKYRLRIPIAVRLTTEESQVVAEAVDLETFGAGSNTYEAIADLRRTLVEDFEFLCSKESYLGPGPQSLLFRYRELLEDLNEPQ